VPNFLGIILFLGMSFRFIFLGSFLVSFLFSSFNGFSQTTYDFATNATLSGNVGSSWPWNTYADITIGGVAYKLSSGGNGSFTNVTSGGLSNSKCIKKDGSGGDQLTLQRTDGQPFQFYGIWVKHQSMNSYSQFYTLPPWYTLNAFGEEDQDYNTPLMYSYQDMTAMTAGTNWNNYTYSSISISPGSGGVAVSSVQISFQAIISFWIDNIIVGPVISTLPVELTSFSSICEDDNNVAVNWTTASEHNSDYYTIEKSRDASTWNVLKTIPAAGNSTQLINYSVADSSDISGTVYYRLTQVDVDGASKVYDIVSTNCSLEKELTLLAYPNPSNSQFSLKIENAKGGKYDLAITDMQGKTIDQQSIDLESGTTVVKLNQANVQPGVYMLELMQDGYVLQYQKLVIE
jgi:hypothetical protein